MKTENPWGLTETQCQLLDLWAITGTHTEASQRLGITQQYASRSLQRAASKMGAQHTTQALLFWDRFAFGREPQA